MTEINVCDCCGNEPIKIYVDTRENYALFCKKCGIIGKPSSSPEQAILNWNSSSPNIEPFSWQDPAYVAGFKAGRKCGFLTGFRKAIFAREDQIKEILNANMEDSSHVLEILSKLKMPEIECD